MSYEISDKDWEDLDACEAVEVRIKAAIDILSEAIESGYIVTIKKKLQDAKAVLEDCIG